MPFFSDFTKGISTHIKAFQFIAKHKLWGYFIVPVCITIVLYSLAIYLITSTGNDWWQTLFEKSQDYAPDDADAARLYDYIAVFLSTILAAFLKFLLIYSAFKLIPYIVLILCSPVMARLSERVDEIFSGKTFPFQFRQFLHDMIRGIKVSLRNMLFELLISIACLFVCWIPIIGWFTGPFLLIMGWYFLGFNMMDYTYERRRMKISEGKIFTRKHKGIAVGNGMIYSFLLMIPFIGMPIAPVLSVVAATLATTDELEKQKL